MNGEVERMPLRLSPCYQERLWGGGRLKREYCKTDAPPLTAESWELAARPEGYCRIADGPLAGKSLMDLCEMDRIAFWGENCKTEEFPILVKLIDTEKDVSVQVHPSDMNALPELGEQGKTEMWYVVDCAPQAAIYYGFSRHMTREEFLCRAKDGSICETLNRIPIKRGDVFCIMPGTIHAIGAGVLAVEVQQNSITTFRIYDYSRRDCDGQFRPLHLERASRVLNYEPVIPDEHKINSMVSFPAFTMTELFSCPYFKVYKLDVRTESNLHCDGESFHHLLCVGGCGEIIKNGTAYSFRRGESFFLPAAMGDYSIRGTCRVLLSRV